MQCLIISKTSPLAFRLVMCFSCFKQFPDLTSASETISAGRQSTTKQTLHAQDRTSLYRHRRLRARLLRRALKRIITTFSQAEAIFVLISKKLNKQFSRISSTMSAANSRSGADTPASLESSTGSLKENRQLLQGDGASSSTRLDRLQSVEAVSFKDPIDNHARGPPAGMGRARQERVTYYIWFLTGMISISAFSACRFRVAGRLGILIRPCGNVNYDYRRSTLRSRYWHYL